MIHTDGMNGPPSYDAAANEANGSQLVGAGPYQNQSESQAVDSKQPKPDQLTMPVPARHAAPIVGLSSPSGVTEYRYHDPKTGHIIYSLLPPDHPSMQCLQTGDHLTENEFGIVGILAAICCFPLGIAICFLDRKTTCRRCGQVLHHGCTD